MFIKNKLYCITLTPVHIGTGEVIEPFNYHIKDDVLYFLNISKFLIEVEKEVKEKFLKIIEINDIIGLRKFIRENINLDKYSVFKIKVKSEISKEYEIKKDDLRNQLLIYPFIRNSIKNTPYIPGSSLKGAIRTAVLNYFLQKEDLNKIKEKIKTEKLKQKSKKIEKLILKYNTTDEDPFRVLKISDADLSKDSTFVAEVFNYNPKNSRFNSMDIRIEMTDAELVNKKIEFEIDITLLQEAKVSIPLNMEIIKEACNQFYKKIALYEYEKFYKYHPELKEVSIRLLNIIEGISGNSFVVRLGRFSHAESMTLEGLRKILIRSKGRKSFIQEEGATRNLALKKYPLGWIKIEIT